MTATERVARQTRRFPWPPLALGLTLVLAACAGVPGGTASDSDSPTVPPPTPRASSSAVAASPTGASASAAAGRHVFVLVLENKDFTTVIGRPDAPFLNSLADRYALAANYRGVSHPSEPNYLALFSGSTQGVTDDNVHDIDAPTLADQIERAGLSWRVYEENVPPGCYLGASSEGGADGPGKYTRKHNPAISFVSISRDPQRCANITDFSHFDPGAANFSLIVPNACHDMHDCSVADGDAWLQGFVTELMSSDAYRQDGLLLITFDEEHGTGDQNLVATIAISASITAPIRSDRPYDHYSLLRTIQERLGLPCLAESCNAEPMNDLLGG